MLFLDSSVVVSLYIKEAKSAKSQRLVSSAKSIAICSLTEVEFYSAIARLNRMKILSKVDATHVIDSFNEHIEQRFYSFYPVNQKVYDKARQWLYALNTPLRSLDALQLAVAQVNNLTFATADRDLAKSAKKLGIFCEFV